VRSNPRQPNNSQPSTRYPSSQLDELQRNQRKERSECGVDHWGNDDRYYIQRSAGVQEGEGEYLTGVATWSSSVGERCLLPLTHSFIFLAIIPPITHALAYNLSSLISRQDLYNQYMELFYWEVTNYRNYWVCYWVYVDDRVSTISKMSVYRAFLMLNIMIARQSKDR